MKDATFERQVDTEREGKVLRSGGCRWVLTQIKLVKALYLNPVLGLMDDFHCLVIQGICNYADSHENKIWQLYAKKLLFIIPGQAVMYLPPIEQGM